MNLSAIVLAAAAATANLPDFSFREHNTGGTYNVESLIAAGCEERDGGFYCKTSGPVAGWNASVHYLVVDRKLSWMQVSGHRDALPELVPALVQRYGAPCKTGTETLTTRAGRQLESPTTTWCFRTGTLVLHHRYATLDFYSMIYRDEVTLPKGGAAAVDF